MTSAPVIGLTPLFASVAAMMARSRERHQHRALAEIDIENRADIAFDDRIIAQQIGDGAIAVSGLPLGREDLLVDTEVAAGETDSAVADTFERFAALRLVDQPGTGDGAGIDHRIERPVVWPQPDRVKRIAARLDADHGLDLLGAKQFQGQREDEGLGDRLDGEKHVAVADLVDVAVDGRQADAEMVRIGLFQLGNIVGERAAIVVLQLRMTTDQEPMQRRRRHLPRTAANQIR